MRSLLIRAQPYYVYICSNNNAIIIIFHVYLVTQRLIKSYTHKTINLLCHSTKDIFIAVKFDLTCCNDFGCCKPFKGIFRKILLTDVA